jgi:glycosyltransferase involved in cell wall biosynthesis
MSVYFKENSEYLKASLESIWNKQTLKPTEIVLVMDGPLTEELNIVIDHYKSEMPLKTVMLEKNLGQGLALSKGIEACSNEIIARMDSDDISYPTRFDRQIEKILDGYDIVSCWSCFFENSIDNIIAIKKRPENHEEIVKLAKKRSPMLGAGSIFKKDAVLKAGNYHDFHQGEDYHLWVRMIMNGDKFYNIQEPLYYVRTSHDQIKRRGGIKYLKNELEMLFCFYKLGFYSFFDLIGNILTRSVIRVLPSTIRGIIMRKIWKS